MSNEEKRVNWQRVLRPLIGLILGAVAGVIAFIVSEPAANYLMNNTSVAITADQFDIFRAAIGFMVFVVFILIFAALFAALAPKPSKLISEAQLDKEKKEKEKERIASRRRKKAMRAKMKQERLSKK